MTFDTHNMAEAPWEVVVIGGGTAGLSAALILARARRRVLVLDSGEPRNRFAPHMHGVLSRDGYSPLQLLADGRREVRAADGVIESATVAHVRAVEEGFEIETRAGDVVGAGRIIVATGIRDDLPAIEGFAEQWGRGVVMCPFCDGFETRGTAIAVFASTPTGLHRAHMLRSYSPDVTVYTAGMGEIPAEDLSALAARGIRLDDRTVVRLVTDGGAVTGLELADGTVAAADVVFAEPTFVALDGVLRELGAEQSETFFGPWTAVDAQGKTSVDRVWAVGSSANPAALVPIAAASGVVAAVAVTGELVTEDIRAAVARVGISA